MNRRAFLGASFSALAAPAISPACGWRRGRRYVSPCQSARPVARCQDVRSARVLDFEPSITASPVGDTISLSWTSTFNAFFGQVGPTSLKVERSFYMGHPDDARFKFRFTDLRAGPDVPILCAIQFRVRRRSDDSVLDCQDPGTGWYQLPGYGVARNQVVLDTGEFGWSPCTVLILTNWDDLYIEARRYADIDPNG